MSDQHRQTENRVAELDACAARTDLRPGATPTDSLCGAPVPPTAPPATTATLDALPAYTRSLLKIKVPVVVTLAQKKHSLRRVLELAPGAIIQFDKSYEEALQLAVGHCPVARAQAVKVGDKFGVCVTSIILPEERFKPVPPRGSREPV
jgi:flagellar motor switch/type III secretory pathway protein FliN